ncbi:hypothetical protein [Flavobacterium sedimenticola]|uniref:hypothetical protein n=1 Tax=Flavobacterium sedimenticola TaxID=3043286 RepID=UPI0024B4E6E5|nr:hypothetical protein [Flavobacterium sedimenticola]
MLFITSLILEVDNVRGWQLLVFGFLGMLKGNGICFLWLANPFLVMSWIFIPMRGVSFRLSLIAVILSILFFIIEESFTIIKIKTYGFGYIVWVLSSFTMLLGNILLKKMPSANSGLQQ